LDLDTNRVVSSIHNFINHPIGCGMIPSPTDSLDVDSLNLNNDLIIDSYISAKSWYQFVCASFPCVNYCFSVIPTNAENALAKANRKFKFIFSERFRRGGGIIPNKI
jgi:hypothetical protein